MSQVHPSLGETYTLTELPRIPDLPLSQRIVVLESQKGLSNAQTDIIDLGISKLIISSYVLKPTPKLFWSYPLPPTTVVNSMDVEKSLYLVGVTERKKSKLLLVKKSSESLESEELAIPSPALGIKFTGSGNAAVLLRNGQLLLVQCQDQEGLSVNLSAQPPALTGLRVPTKESSVIYYTFISNHLFLYNNDLLFYVVHSTKTNTLTYHLLALDGSKSFEIYQVSTQDKYTKGDFSYMDGVLYFLDPTEKTLSSSALMRPQTTTKTISVERLLRDSTPNDLISLSAVASERLLISHRSLVYFINFKFESLLSEHTNNSGNHVYLGFSLPVTGSSEFGRSTFALYLNLEHKTKTCKLKLIQVDVGFNLLSESLGKSIKDFKESKWNGVPSLGLSNLVSENSSRLKDLKSVYQTLQADVNNGDSDQFDKDVLAFFKNGLTESFKLYKESRDRKVDHKFITLVISLIFELNNQGAVQLKSDNFVPIDSLAYFLSHPLYPAKYTKGLAVLLSAIDEELLKIAIVQCTALPLEELLVEFTNLVEVTEELSEENTQEYEFVFEYLRLTINRLVKDHTLAKIAVCLQDLLNKDFDGQSKLLEKILEILIRINTNNSWTLTQAVIDVGGLFNWKHSTVTALSDVIDSKVEALTQNSFNLALTNQAILAIDVQTKTKLKKLAPKVVDNIHESMGQREQLDAILTINNNTSNRKLKVNEGIELAKQIPTYSRERLVL